MSGFMLGRFLSWWYNFYALLLMVAGSACIGWGWYWAGAGLWFFSIVTLGLWVTADILERSIEIKKASAEDHKAKAEFAQALQVLDPDRFSALGVEFPELEIAFEGKPLVRIAGTDLHLVCLQKFLMDSTSYHFATERRYNDDKVLQERFGYSRDFIRRQWWVAVNLLTRDGHLRPNSAGGPNTYEWIKGHRNLLMRWFVDSHPVDIFTSLQHNEIEVEEMPVEVPYEDDAQGATA